MAGFAGDVGVGRGRRLAFLLQLGEVPGVDAGVAERVAGQVEVEAFAEPGDVGRGRAPFDERLPCRSASAWSASPPGCRAPPRPSSPRTARPSFRRAGVPARGSPAAASRRRSAARPAVFARPACAGRRQRPGRAARASRSRSPRSGSRSTSAFQIRGSLPSTGSTSPRIVRWSRQERTICSTQALTGVLRFSAPTISPTISKAVRSPSASASRTLPSSSSTWRRASAIFASGSRKGRPWPGSTEADVERLDLVEAARGIRRPGRGCGRGRRTAPCGRAGGRRRSSACARAGGGRRARGRGRGSRGPARSPRSVSTSTPGRRSRSGSTIASIPVSSSPLRDSR